MFEDIVIAKKEYCHKTDYCEKCPIGCFEFARKNPAEAARLMGYEALFDDKEIANKKAHWIDNADSYICSACGHEVDNPNKQTCGAGQCMFCGAYMETKEDNMNKQDKPRLAEVLGVEVDEEFTVVCREEGINSRPVKITAKGDFCGTGPNPVVGNMILCCAINHPESIIRAPRLTEPENAIMRAVGAKWVTHPADGGAWVHLWNGEPKLSDGHFTGYNETLCVACIEYGLFPSVHPGECIELEDAK